MLKMIKELTLIEWLEIAGLTAFILLLIEGFILLTQ